MYNTAAYFTRTQYFTTPMYQAAALYRTFEPVFLASEFTQPNYHGSDTPEYEAQGSHYLRTRSHESPSVFLLPNRPKAQFIEQASEIEEFVLQAFEKTTSHPFPADITIQVIDEAEAPDNHPGWHKGILGFSKNRLGFGNSQIFLLKNDLDILLITAGHEIGHVLSMPARTSTEEEAKAFAFEEAWATAIKEHDIAGLGNSIRTIIPANNGLHDIAFRLVRNLIAAGKKPFQIYREIATRAI